MAWITVCFDSTVSSLLGLDGDTLEVWLDGGGKGYRLRDVFARLTERLGSAAEALFLPGGLRLRSYVMVMVNGVRVADPELLLESGSIVEICFEPLAGG